MSAAKPSARELQRQRLMTAATRRTEPDAAAPGKSAIRSKPVRITVDLPPEAYRALAEWTTRAATELDTPKVTIADAIRAMVKVTALDNGISAVVVDMLRREKEG